MIVKYQVEKLLVKEHDPKAMLFSFVMPLKHTIFVFEWEFVRFIRISALKHNLFCFLTQMVYLH